MAVQDLLRDGLRRDEGVRKLPYWDTTGHWTVGVGHNLTDKGLPDPIIDALLEWDIEDALGYARHLLPDFDTYSEVRQYVLGQMAFNLGSKLQNFQKFILAVHERRWVDAAIEMLDSRWAAQVGDRAKRLAESMRTDAL